MDSGQNNFAESISELKLLTQTAGSEVVDIVVTKKAKPDPALYIGSGKAQEIRQLMQDKGAEIAIFNHPLSPAQQRNLERTLGHHVIDRTGLILDIFAQRAKSHIGQVQVQLANVNIDFLDSSELGAT